MNFHEAETYLLSLGNEVETMKLGVDNIRKLLSALGDPQEKYLKIQVAGTNGKGSVCAFLDSICREAGIRVGVFTSPHLVSVTERVRISGEDTGEDDFARYATTVRDTAERMRSRGDLEYTPTFFEQITAVALLAFAESEIEVAVLETGLGGRLDATTAANAEIAAITRIDLDHQEYLGDTIEEIAAEKAAIITNLTQAVVVGAQQPGAMRVIVDACDRRGITPLVTSGTRLSEIRLGLIGAHQTENAAVAVELAKVLQARFEISQEHIDLGLERARHPGRLEFDGRYLFDGAHNIGGAKALHQYLDGYVDRPITIVFSAMKGKDVRGFADIIFPKADKILLTRVESSRSLAGNEIAAQLSPGDYDARHTQTVSEALKMADELTAADGIILVTGSLYLIGEVKRHLRSRGLTGFHQHSRSYDARI